MKARQEQLSRQIEAYRARYGDRVTQDQLAYIVGAHRRLIHQIVRLDCFPDPVEQGPEPRFPVDVVPLCRRALRLHFDLGVGWTSMELVLRLLERIEALESRLEAS